MDDDNINKISTPVTFSIIYGSAYCLLVLSLWLLNKYLVAKIQSKFMQIPPKLWQYCAMIGEKKWCVSFFTKNIYQPQNYESGKWGKFLHKEKKSDSSFVIFDVSDFFSFLIFAFSIQIYDSAQGWFN